MVSLKPSSQILILCCFFLANCYGQEEHKATNTIDSTSSHEFFSEAIHSDTVDYSILDSLASGLAFQSQLSYSGAKTHAKKWRTQLQQEYNTISDSAKAHRLLDSAATLLSKALLLQIIPHWYGTEWDFNGHSPTPNQGQVACGYFVSTTLRDAGLQLNRYHLAQKGPLDEALCISMQVNEVNTYTFENIDQQLLALADGLYFVGLDNHVGYLYKHMGRTYFIHSNYIANKVMVETTQASEAFHSNDYHIVSISQNMEMARRWLLQKEIETN